MKIAVFYHLPFGGAKRVVKEHIKGLREQGHIVDLYELNGNEDIFDPKPYASNFYSYSFSMANKKMPFITRIRNDFFTFYLLKELHKKIALDIDQKNYDIALIHTDIYTQAPFILQFLKTKNVYFCLEPLRMAYEYSLEMPSNLPFLNKLYEIVTRSIRKRIDRENARSADYSLAISYFGREYMIHSFNLYPEISYLGVDENIFHPIKIKKKRQVLFVAEKEYIYGYDLAKQAIELIPQHIRPDLKIVFGTQKKQRISDKELVKLYNESLVTLSLSRYDTFGLIPLESMACAVPVIALHVAAYRETIIDKKVGYLVEFNPQEIADRILLFLNDAYLSEMMGREGRKWIEENWTWKKEIKKLESFLCQFSQKKYS